MSIIIKPNKELDEWIKQQEELFRKYNPPDFITHSNYLNLLKHISQGIKLESTISIKNKINHVKQIDKKVNLINLTLKGLKEEKRMIEHNNDYAVVCVSWISVKAYYLIYNLCLILKYFLTGNPNSFNTSHTGIMKDVKGFLERKDLVFSEEKFNRIYLVKDALNWKTKSGANLRRGVIDIEERFRQIIKKLANYSLEELQRQNKISNFRSKRNKVIYNNFVNSNNVNIFEFFYWYRIKANYRDLEYLNKNIKDQQFCDFYNDYFDLTLNIYMALKELINNLSKIRLGKGILF